MSPPMAHRLPRATHRVLGHPVRVVLETTHRVARDVERLLRPFDDPHGGASTCWHLGEEVLPGDGRGFVLRRDGEVLRRTARAGEVLDVLLHALHTAAVHASDTTTHVLLHAGAVHHRGAALVVAGASGAGKSTLVAALLRAGFGHLAEEATPVELGTGRLRPHPRHLDLDHRAATLLDLDLRMLPGGRELHVLPDDLAPDPPPPPVGTCAVRWIVFPVRRAPRARPALRPVSPAGAVARLATHTFASRAPQEGALEGLARMAGAARAYDLDAGSPGETAAAVAALVGAGRAVTAGTT